ncbi:MAG: tRNA (guanosine(37)-N1)-methyltransferase TrmD [Candidatus Levybacteria bacterium]|nr:tRNA (guanosine(37)-N1)-methyltransferase TrmD [Candidatus Levybacteria bacterium]
MKISVITLFPELFKETLNYSILKRAQEKGLITFNVVNHRDFGIGRHKIVDDRPYGGGVGMVLRSDVLLEAIKKTKENIEGEVVILMDPQGMVYSQKIAEELTKFSHIILVCGHYEGFDERIREFVDMEISLGDFVLTGGEIPAMAIIDSITRLIPGVLKDITATKFESHSEAEGKRILEGPSYTRPEIFEKIKVPQVLLSGDPKKIAQYKKEESIKKTKKNRPDLL